jgi:molecular chaperone HscB
LRLRQFFHGLKITSAGPACLPDLASKWLAAGRQPLFLFSHDHGNDRSMSSPQNAITASACWSCSAATNGAHFCPVCGKIQPLQPGSDYFAFFGKPRKLWFDMSGLEQDFLQLSWKLHPDNFMNASERERELSLELTSQLNDAHRVLRDPVSRVEYLLELEGARKEGEHKQKAPPELLEEVFELNESLDEMREAKNSGGDLSSLRARLEAVQANFQEKLREVDSQLKTAAEQWDGAIDANASVSDRDAIMIRLNELLNRRSYIRNLVNSVGQELL